MYLFHFVVYGRRRFPTAHFTKSIPSIVHSVYTPIFRENAFESIWLFIVFIQNIVIPSQLLQLILIFLLLLIMNKYFTPSNKTHGKLGAGI